MPTHKDTPDNDSSQPPPPPEDNNAWLPPGKIDGEVVALGAAILGAVIGVGFTTHSLVAAINDGWPISTQVSLLVLFAAVAVTSIARLRQLRASLRAAVWTGRSTLLRVGCLLAAFAIAAVLLLFAGPIL
jgi:hypothetical protein